MTAVILAAIGLELLIPLLMQRCIDAITVTAGLYVDFQELSACLLMLVVVYLAVSLIGYIEGILSARLRLRMMSSMRRDMFSQIIGMYVSDSDSYHHGEIMSRVINDVELSASAVITVIDSLFSGTVVIIGSAILMMTMCVPLTVVSIAVSVVSLFVVGMLSGFMYMAMSRKQSALGTLNAFTEDCRFHRIWRHL